MAFSELLVEAANARDAPGVAPLYEEHVVMEYPPDGQTVGREAIRAPWEKVLASGPRFEPEEPLPALVSGDIALTATVDKDGAGARAQVVRRQADGTWLRLLDLPEFVSPTAGWLRNSDVPAPGRWRRIRTAQAEAVREANTELLRLYWTIGRALADRRDKEGWRAKLVGRLAADVQREFPGMSGFSPRSLAYVRAFALAWPNHEVVAEAHERCDQENLHAQRSTSDAITFEISLISAVRKHALCMHTQDRLGGRRRNAGRLTTAAHRPHLTAHTLHTHPYAGLKGPREKHPRNVWISPRCRHKHAGQGRPPMQPPGRLLLSA